MRWPAQIKAGSVTKALLSHNDWIPTLCAIAGEADIVGKCRQGYEAPVPGGSVTYKVHLDGFDQSKFLMDFEGTANKNNGVKSARDMFFYSDDDGLLVGLRQGNYKYVFSEQRVPGTMQVWAEPFTTLRLQKIFNLYMDPFERADITSNTYWDWQLRHVQMMYGVMADVMDFAESFKEFPPRSYPPSFNPANIMEEVKRGLKARACSSSTSQCYTSNWKRRGKRAKVRRTDRPSAIADFCPQRELTNRAAGEKVYLQLARKNGSGIWRFGRHYYCRSLVFRRCVCDYSRDELENSQKIGNWRIGPTHGSTCGFCRSSFCSWSLRQIARIGLRRNAACFGIDPAVERPGADAPTARFLILTTRSTEPARFEPNWPTPLGNANGTDGGVHGDALRGR